MSFSHIWSRLRDCYSNNGRSIDRAYGYFQEINNLYSSVVGDATVQRIIFTNVFIERPEHRDMLVASATVKGVFYAVLTLQRSDIFQIERSTIINERVNWCEESFIFSVTDREQIVKNIFNFTPSSSAGDDDDSEDEDVMHLEEIAQNEEVLEPPIFSKITEIETHPLLTEELETSTTNFTEDSDEEEIIENSGCTYSKIHFSICFKYILVYILVYFLFQLFFLIILDSK